MKRYVLILAVTVLLLFPLCVQAQEGFQYFLELRYAYPFQPTAFQTVMPLALFAGEPSFRLLDPDESLFAYIALAKSPEKPENNTRELFRRLYNRPAIDENKQVRRMWQEAFGVDLWYPYFKAKEVETWVKKKVSVRVFSLKGELHYEKNRVLYSFNKKF